MEVVNVDKVYEENININDIAKKQENGIKILLINQNNKIENGVYVIDKNRYDSGYFIFPSYKNVLFKKNNYYCIINQDACENDEKEFIKCANKNYIEKYLSTLNEYKIIEIEDNFLHLYESEIKQNYSNGIYIDWELKYIRLHLKCGFEKEYNIVPQKEIIIMSYDSFNYILFKCKENYFIIDKSHEIKIINNKSDYVHFKKSICIFAAIDYLKSNKIENPSKLNENKNFNIIINNNFKYLQSKQNDLQLNYSKLEEKNKVNENEILQLKEKIKLLQNNIINENEFDIIALE